MDYVLTNTTLSYCSVIGEVVAAKNFALNVGHLLKGANGVSGATGYLI
jgi:hypothetical protein